jgi:hypothetical protein
MTTRTGSQMNDKRITAFGNDYVGSLNLSHVSTRLPRNDYYQAPENGHERDDRALLNRQWTSPVIETGLFSIRKQESERTAEVKLIS